MKIKSICHEFDVSGMLPNNPHYFRVGSWNQVFLRVSNDGENQLLMIIWPYWRGQF